MTQPATDYGTTLSCFPDIDPTGRLITGLQVLSEALARRITTPRGRLLDDPNYGYDITSEVDDDVSPADVAEIAANMDAEFEKDERVVASVTTAVFNPVTGILKTSTQITTGAGPFQLDLAVGAVTVAILNIGPSSS
jgi:phage baseplate assembly protein W